MQLSHLLFLVTIGQGGEMSAAYTNYPDADECQGALTAITSIFEARGVNTDYAGCLQSSHKFTPFEHGVPADAPRYITLNRLKEGKLAVSAAKDLQSCKQQTLNKTASDEQHWCAITTQSIIE